jgi:PST family polysaccharide transporter/lipopolysaccharide exporter
MTNLDNVVIGKLVGMEQLGFYTVAFTLAGVLTTQLVQLMNQILFPAMSRIREDVERILRVLQRSLRIVSGILTPVVLFMALFPESVVRILFSETWLPAIPALMVLLAMGWVRGIASVFGPVLLVYGRVAALHGMKWKEFFLFGITIIPAVYHFGIVGAAYVLLLVYLLSLFLHIRIVLQEQPGTLATILRHIALGSLPALAAGVTVLPILLLTDVSNVVLGLVFTLVWAVVVYIRERQFILQFWEMRRRIDDVEQVGDGA